MSMILEVPSQYGLVLAAASSSFFVNTMHMILTSGARKASGVRYPTAYASQELADKDPNVFLFNSAQRAHNNFTENHTSFLGALLIAGLRWPVASAALGAVWVVSRAMYGIGYAKSGPKGRLGGAYPAAISDTVLKFMALTASVMLAMA